MTKEIMESKITLGQLTHSITDSKSTECPRCHVAIDARHVANGAKDGNKYQIVLACPRRECQELFIATYRASASGHSFDLFSVEPSTPKHYPFPDSIAKLSAPFVEIHNQAMAAESLGLDQLVGIGLRKSLEFLIKDFTISKNSEKGDAIRAMPLSRCINDHVDDPKIKQCATLATWLGNDETHYTRKWETKDVSDLKLLVKLTVNWIESELMTEKYMAEMAEGKK